MDLNEEFKRIGKVRLAIAGFLILFIIGYFAWLVTNVSAVHENINSEAAVYFMGQVTQGNIVCLNASNFTQRVIGPNPLNVTSSTPWPGLTPTYQSNHS